MIKAFLRTFISLFFAMGCAYAAEQPKNSVDEVRVFLQFGHSGVINSLEFSENGRWIATASNDGSAKLWDVETGTELRTFEGHSKRVTNAVLSPDNKKLATSSEDKTIKIWDIVSGVEIQSFNLDIDYSHQVEFSKDGNSIFVNYPWISAVVQFDLKTKQEVRRFIGHKAYIKHFAISPDGRQLLTGSVTGTARLWNVSTGEIILTYHGHSERINKVAFAPDGFSVVTGSADGTAKVWGTWVGNEIHKLTSVGEIAVETVAFSHDGKKVLTGSQMGAELWDASTGNKLKDHNFKQRGGVYDAEYSPDGRYLVAGSLGRIFLRDANSGIEILEFSQKANAVSAGAISPNGSMLFSASENGSAALWDLQQGKQLGQFHGHTDFITSVAFNIRGDKIITGSHDNSVKIWDLESKTELFTLNGHTDELNGVTFSPDGKIALTTSFDSFRIWDTSSGKQISTLAKENEDQGGVDAVFSKDGTKIYTTVWASDYEYSSLYVWDLKSEKKISSFILDKTDFLATGLTLSPDGNLALVYWYNVVFLHDVTSGRTISSFDFDWDTDGAKSISFSPFGNFTISGMYNGNIVLKETESGLPVKTYKGHHSTVNFAKMTPNQRNIVSVSDDGTSRVWDSESGDEIAQFIAFDDNSWLVFTPSGFFNASSPEAARNLNVMLGLDPLSMENFYSTLYRPDLVREALNGDPDGIYAHAISKLDLNSILQSGLPPVAVSLGDGQDLTIESDEIELNLKYKLRDGGVGRIEWRVNGVIQEAIERGLAPLDNETLEDSKVGSSYHLSKKLSLIPGENSISVVLFNESNLIASDPLKVIVTSNASASKPSLHVLAVGVDDYFDSRLKLNYALADARAIGQAFEKAGKGFYQDVKVNYVFDEGVTRSRLTEVFDRLQDEIDPEDVFVFFLAGHGKTLDGQYYYLPQKFRYQDEDSIRGSGIGQDQFQSWFSQVKAQKSLLLYDTCESGSLTQETATRGIAERTAIERLSRAVGRTIMTASTDTQPALEGHRGHGLFTYTILEAFSKADVDEDNLLEVNELIGYVDERLPILSHDIFGYRQIPQYKSRGSLFGIGQPVAVLDDGEEIIAKTATHVVIMPADTFDSLAELDYVVEQVSPGTSVRVVETKDGYSLIAKDGIKIGWVKLTTLVILN